jgi:tRNA-modifying protein YgfZ
MIIGGMSADLLTAIPDPLAQGAVRLTDWGLIRAHGTDSASFLQGQLTNSIANLKPGQARLAGYCSAKGRLLASFIVWQDVQGDLLLACSADLLPATLKRLSMFVMRAKCQLSDASDELALWGLSGELAQAWMGDDAPSSAWTVKNRGESQLLRLPETLGQARFLFVTPTASAAPDLPPLPLASWQWLEVSSAVVRIVAATTEAFVPQMVNLELVGGVDFQKGCYPGQEVVARSQYRGTLKRRAVLLDALVPMPPGAEVFHTADPGQPAGTVALSASLGPSRHRALVELKLQALEGGQLHLGAADGPVLQNVPLPYALGPQAD